MNDPRFTIQNFKGVLGEIFEVALRDLSDEYDLSLVIKDSMDLGELVAVLKNRYAVEPINWEDFKVRTTVKEVFENFKPSP